MTTEVKLSPGWLLRDVRIAAERLDPSQRESGPTPGREEHIVAREGDEPNQTNPQAQDRSNLAEDRIVIERGDQGNKDDLTRMIHQVSEI